MYWNKFKFNINVKVMLKIIEVLTGYHIFGHGHHSNNQFKFQLDKFKIFSLILFFG
jgi:hypothetical protein